jgi:hypothetical protein
MGGRGDGEMRGRGEEEMGGRGEEYLNIEQKVGGYSFNIQNPKAKIIAVWSLAMRKKK